MGASVSKSKRHSYGKTMKRRGRGKSMRKRTMRKRTMRKQRRTMRKQRGGYVYSGERVHRSTGLARGITLNKPKSNKKSKSKSKSRKSRK